MAEELKACPFCGDTPELPSGDGTQYEIECGDCGQAMASVQICDLMTLAERATGSFTDHRYGEEFVERAKLEAIERWNTRAKSAPAEPVSREAVELFPLDSTPEPGWDAGYESGYNDACAQINAPPSPDAELVELLIYARKRLDNVGRQDLYINYEGVSEIKGRIDAKLSILK